MVMGNGKHLSAREVGELLGVSPRTLTRWDQAGKLVPVRHPSNGYRYYRWEDVEPFVMAAAGGDASSVEGAKQDPASGGSPRRKAAPRSAGPQASVERDATAPPALLACRPAEELDECPPDEQWLVEGLWSYQAVGVIGGEPKCCKSFLALDLAVAVASGKPCLRKYPVPRAGRVLLFAAEDPHHVVRERLSGIARASGTTLSGLDVQVVGEPIRLDLEQDRLKIHEAVGRLQPSLLILDPFVRLHRIAENAVGEVAPILAFLRDLQREFRASVMLVHHMKKGGGNMRGGQALRGSGELHAWGDSNLYLRKKEGQFVLQIEHRAAASDEGDLALELRDEGEGLALRIAEATDETEATSEAGEGASSVRPLGAPAKRIVSALRAAGEPLSFQALRKKVRMKTETFGATLKGLVTERVVEKVTDKKAWPTYLLRGTEEEIADGCAS